MSIRDFFTRNQEFIDVALKEGFFDDVSNGDYLSSNDSIILFWINELDKERLTTNGPLNENKVREVLANFRKFIQRGIKTKGVGTNYDLLILAEKNNLVVTPETLECILMIKEQEALVIPKELNTTKSRRSYFHTIHILRSLRRFQLKGYKINSDFAALFNNLMCLEDSEEPVVAIAYDEESSYQNHLVVIETTETVPIVEPGSEPQMRSRKK